MRLRGLAASRVRFGYRRQTVTFRREVGLVNPKRIYRLYTEDGVTVRTKCARSWRGAQRTDAQGDATQSQGYGDDSDKLGLAFYSLMLCPHFSAKQTLLVS